MRSILFLCKIYLFKEPVCDKGHTVVWESSPEKCKWDKQNELGRGKGGSTHMLLVKLST